MAKKSKSGTAKTVEKKTGAGAAMAAHSKDTGKQVSAKPAAKKAQAKKSSPSKTAAAAKSSAPKSSKGGTSIAGKVLSGVKATASGAVNLAGSIIGRSGSQKS